jgi:thiosulfate reductase cytochrome b subunit
MKTIFKRLFQINTAVTEHYRVDISGAGKVRKATRRDVERAYVRIESFKPEPKYYKIKQLRRVV